MTFEQNAASLRSSNNPKGRVPRALPVGEWELAHRASSIACGLGRVPRALPVGIYKSPAEDLNSFIGPFAYFCVPQSQS